MYVSCLSAGFTSSPVIPSLGLLDKLLRGFFLSKFVVKTTEELKEVGQLWTKCSTDTCPLICAAVTIHLSDGFTQAREDRK